MIVKEERKLTKFGVEEGPSRYRRSKNIDRKQETKDEWGAPEQGVSRPETDYKAVSEQ